MSDSQKTAAPQVHSTRADMARADSSRVDSSRVDSSRANSTSGTTVPLRAGRGGRSHAALRVVFLDAATMPGGLPLNESDDIDYVAYDFSAGLQVAERIRDAEVVITNKVPLGRAELAAASRLKLIAVAAAGTDIIDHEAARERAVAVRNVPDYGSESVAEHAIAMLFALRRGLFEYAAAARDGRWSASSHFCWHGTTIRDVKGATLGVVGYGRIGQCVAQRARCLGMRVLHARLPGRPDQPGATQWDDVLRQSDVISLHVPLTDRTRGLIDAQALSRMRPDAILINTGRGALVDAAALVQALREGRIGGAAIDVLDVEPPPADHPLLQPGIPNLLVTPHVAWASEQAQARLAQSIVGWLDAARRWARDGTPLPEPAQAQAVHAAASGPMTPAGSDPLVLELEDVARRWAGASEQWFSPTPEFDASIRRSWTTLHDRMLAIGVAPERIRRIPAQAALGWILLLDQFPRNAYRGTAHVYDSDALARSMTSAAIEAGHDLAVPKDVRLFFYLPFMHAEDLVAQERSVQLHERGGIDLRFAKHHRDIIRRFGRFPHRNEMLGRTSSEAELRYLADGGFRG